ncbi:MAG: MlaD family protein [Burkholderiales bacterium]
MENRSHAIAAGLFTLVFCFALVATWFWLRGENVMHAEYVLVSRSSVAGLNPQAAVRYRGVQVGKVQSIGFDAMDSHNILINVAVNPGTPVTQDTYAQLAYQGLTGLAYVQLNDDGGKGAPVAAGNGPAPRILVRPSQFEQLSSGGEQLLGNLNHLTARLDQFLTDDNMKHFQRTLANVETLSSRLISMQGEITPALDALPGVADDARIVLKRADGLVEDMSRTTRSLDRLLLRLERDPQSLIFGAPSLPPGPGEPGFVAPAPASSRAR